MKRSKHNLSHSHNTTLNAGELVPVGIQEVLPGDSFDHKTQMLIRSTPLVAPVMHPTHARIHHWYVPHRLVWDEFEDFISNLDTDLEIPHDATTAIADTDRLFNYMGMPFGTYDGRTEFSVLPFRAYNLIWNEWYRDEELQVPVANPTTTAPGTYNYDLQKICWGKDRFTSSRDNPQEGETVTIESSNIVANQEWVWTDGTAGSGARIFTQDVPTSTHPFATFANDPVSANTPLRYGGGLSSGSIDINDLRRAFAEQRLKEARARYGSRFTEYLRYLGVTAPDGRLQRPEYLGGGSQTIQFSEVLDTGSNADNVGALRGHGLAAMQSNRYRRFFPEHGYVISLMSIRPETVYLNGIPRHFLKSKPEEFYQKEFGHIGMTPVWEAEVNAKNYTVTGQPKGTFGYQDNYDEYRHVPSMATGEFGDKASFDKRNWMFARNFGAASPATLNSAFVTCDPPNAAFASTSPDQYQVMLHHSLRARRIVPKSGTPLGV